MGIERQHPERRHKTRARATGFVLTAGQDSSSERPREAKTQRNWDGDSKKREGCLSLAPSSLLVKQERGSLGAAQDCGDSEPPPRGQPVSKARRGISLARRGLPCLGADGHLHTPDDAPGPGSEAERGWHGAPGSVIKGRAYASFQTDARWQGFQS